MINIILLNKYKIINFLNIIKLIILVINGIFIWLNIIHIIILLINNIFYILLNNLEYLIIINMYIIIKLFIINCGLFKFSDFFLWSHLITFLYLQLPFLGWGFYCGCINFFLFLSLCYFWEHRGTEKLCEYKSIEQCLPYWLRVLLLFSFGFELV